MNQTQYVSGAIDPTGCISQAWAMVTNRFWLYVGAGLVVLLLIGCIPIVSWFMYGPIMAGYYYLGLRDLRGEPLDFGMLFKGFEKFVPLMVAGIVQQIPGIILTVIQWTVDVARLAGVGPSDANFYQSPVDISSGGILAGLSAMVIVGIILAMIFSIIWTVALSFAVPLIAEHDLSVGDALVTSLKAAGSNIGGLIGLLILEILVALLGFIALCLGIFIAIPVIYLANVIAYRQVFPYFHQPTAYNTSPPPPDYYGGSFGQGQ